MKKISNIVQGTVNNLTNTNKELKDKRMSICNTCHISYSSKGYGNWCLRSKGGCGCYLPHKTSVEDEKCPKGKW